MDKRDFETKLKNKRIRECVDMLREELLDILTRMIQKQDEYFKYSTTKDLANKAKQYLPLEYSEIANELYYFDIMHELDEYKLDEMLEMYKILENE